MPLVVKGQVLLTIKFYMSLTNQKIITGSRLWYRLEPKDRVPSGTAIRGYIFVSTLLN